MTSSICVHAARNAPTQAFAVRRDDGAWNFRPDFGDDLKGNPLHGAIVCASTCGTFWLGLAYCLLH